MASSSWFSAKADPFSAGLHPTHSFDSLAGLAGGASDSDKMDTLFAGVPSRAALAKPKATPTTTVTTAQATTATAGKWQRNKRLISGRRTPGGRDRRAAPQDDDEVAQPTPKQLLPDVQRFVMRAAVSKDDREAAAVRLAISLGARPPKPTHVNYKQFKAQRMQQKHDDKARQAQFTHPELNNTVSGVGRKKAGAKGAKAKTGATRKDAPGGGGAKLKRLQHKTSRKSR